MHRLLLATVTLLALCAACGSKGKGEGTASQQAPSGAPAAAAAAGTPAQPKGELRIGTDFLPISLDPTKAANILRFGLGETLTRLTTDLKVEPWLAQAIANVDPTTWRVTLRPNAKFHDGSPVTAEAVAASFRRSWETQPAANGLISEDTEVTVVDPITVEFKTPRPDGAFPNNLTALQFVVHKLSGDTASMTGPYKPVRLAPDESLQMEAFAEHWGGSPPIARINIKLIRDPNARVLALQAGDIDLLAGLPLEMVNGLSGDYERPVIAGLRMQHMLFNHTRAPFTDRAVREAIALGIDRDALNKLGFDGQGKVAVSLLPSVPGVDVVRAQTTDVARAKQLLDQAGWTAGGDGGRVKDGRRLGFQLYTYPQRADLTPMAVGIQGQMKALGIEVRIEQTQDITKALEGGEWDAAMYSLGVFPTGDPLYVLSQAMATGGNWNYGKYSNPQMDAAVQRLRDEVDPAKRQALSRQAQEILKADVPNVYIVTSPLAYAYKKGKVRGLTLHPNDLYMIDRSLSVQ